MFFDRATVPFSMIEWGHLDLREEADMAIRKTIRTKVGSVESKLTRRVSSLEKDVARLMKKLEKKEHEIKKLKDKLTSGQVKNIRKKVTKAKKAVRKHLPGAR
jgi:predicted  nucleic acid-binding Zn-ribbon protein